jgi:SIR2-like domain/TIR domain
LPDTHTESVGEPQATASPSVATPKVFVNYRHEDTQEAAVRLYELLAGKLGAENVFLDVRSMGEGTEWLDAIKQHGATGNVFLALIGRNWLTTLKEREHVSPGDPEDYVALELAMALGRWPGRVIPVLLQDATMPGEERLPRRIKRLAQFQAFEIHPLSFEQDADRLLVGLGAAAREPAPVPQRPRPRIIQSAIPTMPAPDQAHYDEVLSFMLKEDAVVPVLGTGVRGTLPDARELAAHLAQHFGLESGSLELAEVAQRVAVTRGLDPLIDVMAMTLTPQPEPDDTHRFLARLPQRLEQLGLNKRYQMIVTTNYDTALEDAFEAEGEEFDLAVFLANGIGEDHADRGRFLHVPAVGAPEVIRETRDYHKLPLTESYELERTLIVKINGAAKGSASGYCWDGSSMLTEDQYINYLVTDQLVTMIPIQILYKLKRANCLFLGYEVRDWSLRVFLKRIWRGQPLETRSWAIEYRPDALERDLWRSLNVDLLASAPDAYVHELDARLEAQRASGA